LFVAGLAAGGLIPKPLWAHYLGAVAGQLAYETVFLTIGPLLVLGVAFLLGHSLIFVLAAALAAYVRRRYKSEFPEA
jgi:1,4-dihydroxy-2-naphthoate octaprenyltransferase